jgi:hypothetical protein
MKKRIFITIVAVLFAFTGFSQKFGNVIKTGPIGFALGNYNLTYEKTLGSSSSILIGGSYMAKFLGVEINAFSLNGAFRYYFTHKNKEIPAGFYINPQVQYSKGGNKDGDYTDIAFGAEIGYQFAWASGFTLDLGAGPLYHNISTTGTININDGKDTYLFPSFTFALGYAF